MVIMSVNVQVKGWKLIFIIIVREFRISFIFFRRVGRVVDCGSLKVNLSAYKEIYNVEITKFGEG